jgi:hypothetical protein
VSAPRVSTSRAERPCTTISGLVPNLARGYALVGLLGALASGCGGRGADSTADSARGALPPPDTVPPQPVQWEPAKLDTLLHAEGFNPVVVPLPTRNPFVRVPAASYRLDNAELDAYFFGDPVAAAHGISQVAPRGGAASAFTSNNMVVVVRSKSATLRERIRRLLTNPEVTGTLEP